MRATYSILNCCGDYVDTIDIELPSGCVEPDDYPAERAALDASAYADKGRCGQCGDQKYRARYAG